MSHDQAVYALTCLAAGACYLFGVPLGVTMVAVVVANVLTRVIRDRGRAP